MELPVLTVCIITYNHAKYIAQALESVLCQNVKFRFEIVVADDFSTDGTRELLIEYQTRYPFLIKLILQKMNVGAGRNWKDLITFPKTKYIAYFEGDDYWVGSDRLQKQFDFLEGNPTFTIIAGNTKIIHENNQDIIEYVRPDRTDCRLSVLEIEDQIRFELPYHTSSVMFRNGLIKYPNWLYQSISGDIPLFTLLASVGKVGYMDEVLSVYRRHANGISQIKALNPVATYEGETKMFKNLNDHFNKRYEREYRALIERSLRRWAISLNRAGQYIQAYRKMGELYRYSESFASWFQFIAKNLKISIRKVFSPLNLLLSGG